MSRLAKVKALRPDIEHRSTETAAAMDRKVEQRTLTWKKAGIAGAIVIFLGLCAFAYFEYGLNRILRIDSGRLTVSTVERGIFQEYIFVSGNTVPTQTVYLEPIHGGQVTELNAEEGALVEAGQPLLSLKNINLQLQVVDSETRLSEQVNNLNIARLSFEQNRLRNRREAIQIAQQIDEVERSIQRLEPLVGTGVTRRSEIEDLEARLSFLKQNQALVAEAEAIDQEVQSQQMEQLESTINRISSNLELARESLDNLAITAPISGQLTIFEAHLGESKSPGERIGQVDDISGFKVSTFVDEFYLSRIVLGQIATADIGDDSYALQVSKIFPNIQNRQFQVELDFVGEPPENIRRGQTLRMKLDLGAEAESLLLPNSPFINDTSGQWVFVVDENQQIAERRNITLGRLNPNWVEVTGGLSEGERVITSTYARLADFDRINLEQQ